LVSPALQRGEKGFHKFVTESCRDGARTLFMQEPTTRCLCPNKPFPSALFSLAATSGILFPYRRVVVYFPIRKMENCHAAQCLCVCRGEHPLCVDILVEMYFNE
jgi:hypothetical protein